MKLHNLAAPAPNRKTRKRVGRGEGSGLGKQSGRGHKGQKSGSGYSQKRGFEGGQMPLQRRIPKFGFKNPFRKEYVGLNLDVLDEFRKKGKLSDKVTVADLVSTGIIRKKDRVKVLGRGEIDGKLQVEAHGFSKAAVEKIEKAGGTATKI
ncbi:50S ribosomal protein L15 [Natronogracilivirga saccharolytica]|uniref:Large ribosomal subunit protein uL15 n=1 Tax=Natronogracilivirga saccharolytica TaxID=2812953 RepID=A0A8J7UUC3_9BACT|nr:50S ribosomal protein L15 [Natronogracilivirga saccharolytica]MBP3192275.1 50S ribosomal protein L15 [Natronogracilivirga saccharolytica]